MVNTSSILNKRVYAFTTDFLIVIITNYLLMSSFTSFLKIIFFHFPARTQIFFIQKLSIMNSISQLAIFFSYFSIYYFVTNGHTFGKKLFGLKVVSLGQEISLKQSMQRAFAYFTCAFFGSFLFALSFIRKDHKSLADIFSNTEVILEAVDHVDQNDKQPAEDQPKKAA